MKNFKRQAFSLIELSTVIAIIGILIASTIQASIVIQKSRLSKARALSNGSSVTAIDNLVLWLDATSAKAFKEEDPRDGTAIDTWYDVQNSLSSKTNLVQEDITHLPKYIKSSVINGLPALYFDGSSATLHGTNLTLNSASYSIFVVFSITNLDSVSRVILCTYKDDNNFTNNNAKNGLSLEMSNGTQMRTVHRSNPMGNLGGDSNITASTPFKNNTNYILSYSRNFDNASINLWLNKVLVMGAGSTFVSSPTVTNGQFELSPISLTVGSLNDNFVAPRYFKGYISEIIIFNRSLEQDEIDDVKSYLSKKYSISTK